MEYNAGAILALVSAVTQASAHLLLKSSKDKLVIRGVIGIVSALCVAPFLPLVGLPHGKILLWLAIGSLLHTIYQLALITAYQSTDFSIAYPLARGIAPVCTAVLGVTFLGDKLTIPSVVGIGAVTSGMLFISTSAKIEPKGLPPLFARDY